VGQPHLSGGPGFGTQQLYALRAVDARANLLRAGSVLDSAALDKYSFTREVYLQVRREESGRFKRPASALPSDGSLPPEPAPGAVR
jgi:phospholipid-binding lipoprotein MlaA